MMKTMKKVISVLLSVLMITSMLPVTAYAVEGTAYEIGEEFSVDQSGETDNFYWTYTAETQTVYINATENNETGIIDCSVETNGNDVLPLILSYNEDGTPNKILGDPCLYAKHIVIGKDVVRLKYCYFYQDYCPVLETVTFEEGSKLAYIEKDMFVDSIITEISIPSDVQTIGVEAFSGSMLEKITLNYGLKTINSYAFQNTQLKEIAIPDTVTSIGNYAFYNCDMLESVKLPNSNTSVSVGENVFRDCSKLASVDMGEGIETIGNYMFDNCSLLSSINISDSVGIIRNHAFSGCTSLAEVSGGVNVVEIGNYAFKNCSNLESFNFSNYMSDIGIQSFVGTKLQEIDLSNAVEYNLSIQKEAFWKISTLKKVVLPYSCDIAEKAFYQCSNLESVVIEEQTEYAKNLEDRPIGISTIGNYAFAECPNLMEFVAPNSLKTISLNAFYKSFVEGTTLDFGNTELKTIQSNAFASSKLSQIKLPNTLETIGDSAFNLSLLEAIDLSETKVTAISNSAFYGTEMLADVKLPKGLVEIKDEAFVGMGVENTIELPETVTTIGDQAFAECALEYINFPSSLTSIGYMALYGSAIVEADLSSCNNGLVMGEGVFAGTFQLEWAKLPQRNFANLPTSAFGGSSVTSVDIPCVTTVGDAAFQQSMVEEVILPINCVKLGDDVFKEATNLRYVKLPYTVSSIGSSVFYRSSVEEINCQIPSWIDYATAFSTHIKNATVYGIDGTTLATYCQTNSIPFVALAEEELDFEYDPNAIDYNRGTWANGYYSVITYDDKVVLEINGYGALTTNCTLPDESSSTFFNLVKNLGINEIVIGEGITAIPNSFLYNSKANDSTAYRYLINNVTFPSTLESIGSYAFYYQIASAQIELPEGLKTIGNYAFARTKLEGISFPDSVESIGNYSFFATAINSVEINEGMTSIGESAFYGCNLTAVAFKNIDCTIGTRAFVKTNNSSINFIVKENSSAYQYAINYGYDYVTYEDGYDYCGTIPQSNYATNNSPLVWIYTAKDKTLTVGGSSYFNSSELLDMDGKAFDIPLDVDVVEFEDTILRVTAPLEKLNPKLVVLPNTLREFNEKTFRNCDRLVQLFIPETVDEMKSNSFVGCKNLQYIKFGNLIPNEICKGLTSLKFVDLGSASIIGKSAFEGCTNLQEIVIPDCVTTINPNAFYKCTAVQSVYLGKNVTTVSGGAFAKLPLCEKITVNSTSNLSLSSIVFSESGSSTTGVTVEYGDNAQSVNLDSLNSINASKIILGKNVSTVVHTVDIPKLKSIEVSKDNPNFYSYYDCLYSSDKTLLLVPESLSVVDIEQGTKAIGVSAFYRSSVQTVVIPDSVERIDEKAFFEASKVKTVRFGNGLKSIGNSAFEGCPLLKTVDLPANLESIGDRAFCNCEILASVIMPEGLKTIGINAFSNCNALIGAVIPESVESIGAAAFAYCPELKEVYIWYSAVDYRQFYNSPKVNVYTMAGSPAFEFCKAQGVPYSAYTDENCFYDECAMKIDILAGYLGFCTNGHGDIDWLTVYSADCENGGYIIGVCEYCSEILEEKHIDATGHNFVVTANIEPTEMTRGMTITECKNCNIRHCEYTEATGNGTVVETHNVLGTVVIATDKQATKGVKPLANVSVVIDGITVATTNENGEFSFDLTTGIYEAELRYAYGFTRVVYIRVEDEDIKLEKPIPIIGCDFNKDGIIDNEDLKLFQYVVSSQANDPSYLAFVDMNNDGYINAKDRAYINACKGLDASTFEYDTVVIEKHI